MRTWWRQVLVEAGGHIPDRNVERMLQGPPDLSALPEHGRTRTTRRLQEHDQEVRLDLPKPVAPRVPGGLPNATRAYGEDPTPRVRGKT